MIRLRRIINNTIISLLGQAVSWLSTLLLSIAYGHFLGAFLFGELYLAITFVSLIGTPVDFGYGNQIMRDVAQKPDSASRYFSNVLLIKLGTWLIMYAAILLISWSLGYTSEVRTLVAICGFDLLCNSVANTFVSLHYAFERTIHPVVGNILEKGLSTLLGILLLRSGAGVQVMAVVLVGGSLVNVVWQAIWYFRLVGFSFVIERAVIREIVRTNIPFLVSGLLIIGYNSFDTVLLSLMTNSTVVGWYGAASRITDAMNFLPTIVILNIMYPVFSKLATTSDAKLKLALEKSMNLLLFCGIPITTMLIVAAPNIVGFLYGGRGFSQAIPALQALAPYVVFLYFDYPLASILLSKKQDRKMPIITVIGLVFNLGLNFLLIPLYQHVGAAIVASLTELLLCFICIAFTPRHLRPVGSLPVALKALVASLVMALAILLLHTLLIFVLLPIAMLVYFGVALLLRTIPREDYQALYHAIRQKAQRSPGPSTDGLSETSVPLYDLPTMVVPAYYNRGSLLDIELAITGKLPVIRLPLAPQRTGLATNSLSKIPALSYALPIMPGSAHLADYTDSLLDIEMAVTAKLPAIHLQSEQGEAKLAGSSSATVITNAITPVGTARTDNPVGKEHISNNGGMIG